MYERRRDRPVSQAVFFRRVGTHVAAATLLVLLSIGLGMAGYSYFERLPWRDAFLNSAMLLGGMGPVETPATPGDAKGLLISNRPESEQPAVPIAITARTAARVQIRARGDTTDAGIRLLTHTRKLRSLNKHWLSK